MGRAAFVLLLALLAPALLPTAEASGGVERALVSFHGAAPPPGPLGDLRVVEAFPFADLALVEGAPRALDELAGRPDVAGVYPEEIVTLQLDRARRVAQADPQGEGVAPSGWPLGRNVTVALVDSGIDAQHPGFEGRVAAAVRITKNGQARDSGADLDGHGTHVAGILAGNGAGSTAGRLAGFAPGVRLVALDISDSFTTTSAVRAFQWIHDNRERLGIRVVSNSWGREKADAHYDPHDPVIRASDALVADGLVVVFSAGNRGRDGEGTLTTEATNPNVISVGAASATGRVEPYSSRGPARDASGQGVEWIKPDLVATGTAIVSARTSAKAPASARSDEERLYVTMNGTSMAAPQVAAAAALLVDAHPDLSPQLVQAILAGTARDLGPAGPDPQTGHGMLDVGGALRAAAALGQGEREVVTQVRVPVRLEGTVLAASSLVVLSSGTPHLPPGEEVRAPLVLPKGATGLALWFNWTGTGDFDVHLERDGVAWPFRESAAGSLHLARAAPAGTYALVARPTGVAAHTPWTLSGSLLVEEVRLVEVGAEFHARPFTPQGGFFVPQSPAARFVAVAQGAPGLLVGVCAGLATLAGVARRRT